MNESIKTKDMSPLVLSVVALDGQFSELERLSARIDEVELKSEFDFEQVRKLMTHFAECGNSVSEEIVRLASLLNDAKTRAEAAAKIVAEKAEVLHQRHTDQEAKMETFRNLAIKVATLSESMKDLKRPEGEVISEEVRKEMTARFAEYELQMAPLIEEARILKDEARESKLKGLEQQADSLRQSLISAQTKLAAFSQLQNSNPVQ